MRTTVIFLVLGVMLMLSFNLGEVEARCYTNGCSIPFNLPYFYKSQFTPSCNKHDVCYACGVRNGWTRYQCDRAFKRDMDKRCGYYKWLERRICYAHATDYYNFIRAFGRKFHRSPSLWWCTICLKTNGDPNKVHMFGRK